MITIPGGIVRGLGAGAKTVKLQMPHFLKDCQELEISLSHPSTCTIHLSARAFRELAVPICRTEQSGYQPRQRFLVDD